MIFFTAQIERFCFQIKSNDLSGYYTDKAIGKIKLPSINKGVNVLEITYPFDSRTSLENCFILGDFNVRLEGCTKTIISKTDKIGFGDIVAQGLPFYGANITYIMDFEVPEECDAVVNASNYVGMAIKVKVDGKEAGIIAFAPYDVYIENISKGIHQLEITLLGNRHNSFGSIHLTDDKHIWYGPTAWNRDVVGNKFNTANEFSAFKYEYSLKPMGIMASPEIKLIK